MGNNPDRVEVVVEDGAEDGVDGLRLLIQKLMDIS
jgi:hypothetical protein